MSNSFCDRSKILVASILGLILVTSYSYAQTENPAQPIKRVLMYNKCGGWVHTDGLKDVYAALKSLAASKGFLLDSLKTEAGLTLENLKRYQVIVWNNNVNGARSVDSEDARKAVMDYVNQGGGWLLIHGAGDHGDTWKELSDVMGTRVANNGNRGSATLFVEPAAKEADAAKTLFAGLTDSIRLFGEWHNYENTVRGLSNITVLYSARNGDPGVLRPLPDGSKDFPYVWSHEVGLGRVIYNGVGHGGSEQMSQNDSVVPKLYWNCMRYVAKADMISESVKAKLPQRHFAVTKGTQALRVHLPHPGDFQVALRDIRGAVVWKESVQGYSGEITLTPSMSPGIYQIEMRSRR